MKRVIFEWGAITALFLALACFGFWVVSLLTPRADFDMFVPLGHWKSMQIKGSAGEISFSDRYDSLLVIETVGKHFSINPPISGATHWSLPGFRYRSIGWGSRITWCLECSLLIPGFLLVLAAVFLFYGYARVRRQALERFQQQRHEQAQLGKCTTASVRTLEAPRV